MLDASAWVIALVDAGPAGDSARQILSADPDWMAPAHTKLEVLRTLRRYESTSVLDSGSVDGFATEVKTAELRQALPDEDLLAYVWRHRHNVSPYDAPYLGLATRYRVPLVTSDLRLARAADSLDVAVVVPGER